MKSQTEIFDVAIVGGGIFGLWIARQCSAAGLTTCLVDKSEPGRGASGGLLGALMPHMPDRWDEKKQFQFEALCALPDRIADLEAETGLSAGYRRTGRIMPVRTEQFRKQIPERQDGAGQFWTNTSLDLRFDLIDGPEPTGWLAREEAPLGFTFENLSARIDPRAAMAALSASVRAHCAIKSGTLVQSIDGQNGLLKTVDGGEISAGSIVLAAGYESFPFLENLTGLAIGKGVKGQSVVLQTRADPDRPIVYDDGTYVIVHDDGRTAIGSTSEPDWSDPFCPDPENDRFLRRAYDLVPQIRNAPIVEWWAGVRPRCQQRDPVLGRLPMHPRVIAATGGFKISFGIAHKIADAVVCMLSGTPPALPATFTVDHHLAKARSRLGSSR